MEQALLLPEERVGIIKIQHAVMVQLLPEISLSYCDPMGRLEERGLFARDFAHKVDDVPAIPVLYDAFADKTSMTGEFPDFMGKAFARLHQKLLLPASYKITALCCRDFRLWEILVASADLPPVPATAMYNDLPEVLPTYCRTADGKTHLVSIEVVSRKTVPVTGGIEWMLAAMGWPVKEKVSRDDE